MILKVLLVGVVIYIVYTMFLKQKKEPSAAEQQKNNSEVQADEMVECNECGVYVAISEAILSNGKYYCSKECLIKAKS
jgi:uncharacterized protein